MRINKKVIGILGILTSFSSIYNVLDLKEFSLNTFFEGESLAEELSVEDRNLMLGASAPHWQSSSLREWLNSDKDVVDYTAFPPSYKDESGFLSNTNFTQGERDAIAITRHGAGSGGAGYDSSTYYISQKKPSYNNYIYNDKVFILNYGEMLNYIERNKELLNMNKKYYSDYLQYVTNKNDKYTYLVNSGYYHWSAITSYYLYMVSDVTYGNTKNIVPALSLKPDYILSSGVRAKDLLVGSLVTFGKYNGEPIEWRIINKSDDGYPLLWSERILTIKEYDAPGDINPNTSNYINYPTYEVDTVSGNGQAKSWETQNLIDSAPTIEILNREVLTTPTNDESITLQIKATDLKYGIRRIILPDGAIVNGDYAEWELTKNGEYDVVVENNEGVISVRHIVTKAINIPSTVNITTDIVGSSKYSNKTVNVAVSASNNGVYTRMIYANKNIGKTQYSADPFPSWMPLGGKRLHVTGTFKNVLTDEQASKLNMNVTIVLRVTVMAYTDSSKNYNWPVVKEFTIGELKEKGEIVIDEIFTIQNNAYNYVSPKFYIVLDSNQAKLPYDYWASDFTFELIDKDDLTIEEIALPDGTIVYDDQATYVINDTGTYTFSAKDNRGKITSKTIEVVVDTTKPNVDVSGVQPGYVKNQTLTISATDDLSGIKSIKLPNGEVRTNLEEEKPLSTTYNVNANGVYAFEVTDYAGNKTTKSITINNIEYEPTLDITPIHLDNYIKLDWNIDDTWQSYTYKLYRKKSEDAIYQNIHTSTSKSLNDANGKDITSPSKPIVDNAKLSIDGAKIDFNFNHDKLDLGTSYSYYLEATGQNTGKTFTSDIVSTTITSGFKGYSYLISDKPIDSPDNTVDTTSVGVIAAPKPTTDKQLYLHIASVDEAGNMSEVEHFIVDMPIIDVGVVVNGELNYNPNTDHINNATIDIDNNSNVAIYVDLKKLEVDSSSIWKPNLVSHIKRSDSMWSKLDNNLSETDVLYGIKWGGIANHGFRENIVPGLYPLSKLNLINNNSEAYIYADKESNNWTLKYINKLNSSNNIEYKEQSMNNPYRLGVIDVGKVGKLTTDVRFGRSFKSSKNLKVNMEFEIDWYNN